MKVKICSRRWKARKLNNRGSSLALVMMVVAIIGILGVVILSTSLSTYRMKETYLKSQKNFYSAESVMDAIHVGLQQDVAASAGAAYSFVLEHYGDSDEAARRQKYVERYESELLGRISGGIGGLSRIYSLDHLGSLVPGAVKDGALNKESATTPLISSWDGTPYLNQDQENGTYTIKNLWVRYIDENNFLTEIRTDIVLSSPKIDFSQKSSEPLDLTNYTLVACEETIAADAVDLKIKGNAYLGDHKAVFSSGKVKFEPTTPNSGGKLVMGGTLEASNAMELTIAEGYSVWAHEIQVNSATLKVNESVVYLNDDLLLKNSLRLPSNAWGVTLGGRLYAYGNPANASLADAFTKDAMAAADLAANPANYSSAILINGRNATLDMSGLEDLIIAGTAYVAAEENPGIAGTPNDNVQMGETVALKASQRAYLVPANLIGRYSSYGGLNPMTHATYEALQNDICAKLRYYKSDGVTPDWSKINNPYDYLRASEDEVVDLPRELKKYHVTGVQTEFYTTASSTMVYLFLKFASEADAVNWATHYYGDADNLATMQGRVANYDTTIYYPTELDTELREDPADVISDFTFYYNGGVVLPSSDKAQTKFVSGQCTKIATTSLTSLTAREWEYQNTFSALRHCLIQDFSDMTLEQMGKKLKDNLMVDMNDFSGEDALKKKIQGGGKKVFSTGTAGIDADSQMCAIVVNGDYTLANTTGADRDDAIEMVNSQPMKVHLVIASGNVTVDSNFRGLIIAGGTVTFTSKCENLSADSNLAQQALKIPNADGVCPVEYLVNGQKYLVDGNGAGSENYGMINYADFVIYRNWTKQ